MSRITPSLRWFLPLVLVFAASAAFAQEEKPPEQPDEAAGETPGGGPLRMTEGQRSRAMEPPWGKFWPIFEVDFYNRAELGPEPGYEGVDEYVDFDFLMPFFGYRRQVLQAQDDWPAGEYGFSYAFPVWWNRWRPDRSDALLMPVAWHSNWRTGSRTVIPPLLATYGTNGDDWDASILWPIFAAEQRGDAWTARAAPLAWAGGNADYAYAAVFPLLWYDATSEYTRLLTPLGGHYRDQHTAYTMATPLYHQWQENYADGTPRRGGRLGLPVFGHLWEEGRSGTVALPGVVYLRDDAKGRFLLGGPVWGKASPDGKQGAYGLFPLVWRFWDEYAGQGSLTVLPLVHHRQRGDEGETVIFPVLWDFRRPGERHTHAWPVYGRDASYDADGNIRYEQHSVAWPFFKVWHDHENGTSGWDAPFPIAGYRGSDSHSQAWVMPIAWYERTEDKWGFVSPALLTFGAGNAQRADLVQMPFYWYFRRGEQTTAIAPFSHYRRTGDYHTWSSFFPVTYGAWNEERWAFRLLWEGLAFQGGEDEFRMRVLGGLI
ncbi:MAG: hypothetical protein ACYTGX_17605, partial [Planctomycetota bacterium]